MASIFEIGLLGLLALALAMAAMAVTGLAGAFVLYGTRVRGADRSAEIETMSNPLALMTVLSFGVILTLVVLGTYYLRELFGDTGIYTAAALSGIADVDALTISVARMTGTDFAETAAAVAIFIAVSVNTAVKAGIALAVGGRALGFRVIGVYIAVLAAGAMALALA